jgi:hypothetical protein
MYHGSIKSNGRDVRALISDGWHVSCMYAKSEAELRRDFNRHGIKSVTELTSKMCRGERVNDRHIRIINKLL